ncbi:MAG: HlyD family efflux transporter periplasmic adaptor subunit [Lautropia sp.]|nr:HlyD family efflux transporter periplasmic adaptor subunit [Lautropia sp.]
MKMPSGKTLFYLLAGAAVLAFLGWSAFREPEQLARVVRVERAPLTQTVSEEGKTRLKHRYRLSAPVTGNLRRIAVQPGDRVEAGQVLAHIDPATSSLLDARARSQAKADLRAGQSEQRAARQKIAAARAEYRLATTALKRARTLREGNTISQETLDQAEARASTAAADLSAARADAQAATQRVLSTRAQLAQEGRALEHSRPLALVAPVTGVVLRRPRESAGPVTAGELLVELGDTHQLEIEAEVLSTDAVRLKPGMPVRIPRWGGDEVLQALVVRVEPGGFTKTSALGVEEQRTRVIVDILSPHDRWAALGDAYRVELDFILQHLDDALQVPASALFRIHDKGTDGKPVAGWALYRVEEGRARRTPVKTGLRSATAVQILDGVKESDAVIAQPDDRIQDGTRIEAH